MHRIRPLRHMPLVPRLLRIATLVIGTVGATAVLAAAATSPAGADLDRTPLGGARSALLNGAFTFHPCAAGAPDADFCLADHLTGAIPDVGQVAGDFEVR